STSGWDGFASIWEASTGKLFAKLGPHGHQSVEFAVFSPDGTQVVTADLNGAVRIWTLRGELVRTVRAHRARVNAVVWAPGRILTASTDGSARIYDPDTGIVTATFEGHGSGVFSARFDNTYSRVLTGSFDGTARVWRYRSYPLVARLGRA